MRGGTSKGLFFRAADLPAAPEECASLFLGAMGSPDSYGRQLDGMGGGQSSLSKVMVVSRSERAGVDLDYTFAQVAIGEAVVDFSSNCGNLTSAVGPFGLDEALVTATGPEARLVLFNTNSGKQVVSRFALDGEGRPLPHGGCRIAGVSGTAAPIRLDFLEPEGSATGFLLPTGKPVDWLEVPGAAPVQVSLVDAATPVAFVRAGDLGLVGSELPGTIAASGGILDRLEAIRLAAAIAMGLAGTLEEAARTCRSRPKIAMVAAACDAPLIDGSLLRAADADITMRMISMGQPHNAVPLTGGLCAAVAARLPGTLVAEASRTKGSGADLIAIAHPSGVLDVSAEVTYDGGWRAVQASVVRTARRLMSGLVYPGLSAADNGRIRS